MRKTKVIVGICICSLLCITGCGASLPEMTEEQENAIVEYAASIVMRHTRDYDSRLVDLSIFDTYEDEQEPDEPGGMDPVEDTPVIDSTGGTSVVDSSAGESVGNIAQVLLPENIDIVFSGYRVVNAYPDGDSDNPYFALDASAGNKYLVLGFTMSNNTGTGQEIDIFSQGPRFTVLINGTERTPIMTTMLLDDLGTYVGSLGAGEEVKLVLLAEIEETLAGEITGLQLSVTTSNGSVVMPLE
ncbi:MAG: hypothetical protein J1E65_09105 [Lachnospiraceae bacterium]|nr:hypothetical protein [Lachnospiraceae bacterium]